MEEKRFSNIILENREKLSISAVNDVYSFDEEMIVINTDLGDVTIKGENLHINSFDNIKGELKVSGNIDGLVYTNETKKEGFLKRVFK